MTDLEWKARGQHAENLLRDELLQEALLEIRYAAHRAFERSSGSPEAMRRAHEQLEASKLFEAFLRRAVTRGKEAAKKIDRDLQGGRFVRGVGRLSRNRDPLMDEMPWNG